MKFDSFADFLAMGGHGLFVWTAYAIAVVVIVVNLLWPVVQQRRYLARLRDEVARESPARDAAGGSAS